MLSNSEYCRKITKTVNHYKKAVNTLRTTLKYKENEFRITKAQPHIIYDQFEEIYSTIDKLKKKIIIIKNNNCECFDDHECIVYDVICTQEEIFKNIDKI